MAHYYFTVGVAHISSYASTEYGRVMRDPDSVWNSKPAALPFNRAQPRIPNPISAFHRSDILSRLPHSFRKPSAFAPLNDILLTARFHPEQSEIFLD